MSHITIRQILFLKEDLYFGFIFSTNFSNNKKINNKLKLIIYKFFFLQINKCTIAHTGGIFVPNHEKKEKKIPATVNYIQYISSSSSTIHKFFYNIYNICILYTVYCIAVIHQNHLHIIHSTANIIQ